MAREGWFDSRQREVSPLSLKAGRQQPRQKVNNVVKSIAARLSFGGGACGRAEIVPSAPHAISTGYT